MKGQQPEELLVDEQKILLQTPLCDVVSAEVTSTRTGRKAEFYRLDFSDWVNVVALTESGGIIIVRQFRFGSSKVEIEIPGGAIEKGEDPLLAGQRELLEEAGYSGKNGRVIGRVCPNPAIQNNWCYTVLVEDVVQVAEQNMDDMEDITVNVIPLPEMDKLMRNGDISHGLVHNAMMLFAHYQQSAVLR